MNYYTLTTLILALLGLVGSMRLACFFALRLHDQVFRSFLIYFVIISIGFAWLVWADLNALAGQSALASSPVRAIVFRALFVGGIYQLVFALLRVERREK